MKPSDKLARLAEAELPALLDHVIIADGDGFRVFGKYTIKKDTSGHVVEVNTGWSGTFGTARSALAWCIADKNNQLNLAREIYQLDLNATRLRNDIQCRLGIARKTSGRFLETVETKVSRRQEQSQAVENELSKCINSTKYWQLRGFINETARIGSTPSNRTGLKSI
jgi:hypothetical protein